MPVVLEPPARNRRVVVRAEARSAIAMGVVQAARWAEDVERSPAVQGLGADQRCADHERGAFVQLVRDGVVCGSKPGLVDELDGHSTSPRRIAEFAPSSTYSGACTSSSSAMVALRGASR